MGRQRCICGVITVLLMLLAVNSFGADIHGGADGVLVDGVDGVLSFTGLGDGYDEDWTIDLDNTENTVVFGSTTGVTRWWIPELRLTTDLWVAYGGTGVSTFTTAGLLIGSTVTGAAPLEQVTIGAAGTILRSGGTGIAPSFTTATYPTAAASAGEMLRADGTNWVASTMTYPDTLADTYIPYATAANVLGSGSGLTYDGTTLETTGFLMNTGVANITGPAGASETVATDVLTIQGGTGGAGVNESLGAELLDDDTFGTGGDWTGTDWTIVGGNAIKSTGTGIDNLTEAAPFTVTASKIYKVVLGIVTLGGTSTVQMTIGGVSSDVYDSTGTKTFYALATNANEFTIIGSTGDTAIVLTDCSVKEVTAATAGARGSDLLLYPGAGGAGGTGGYANGAAGASGNVGIGTADPSEALDINGRIELSQQSGSTNDGALWNDSTQEALQTYVSGIEQTLSGVIFTQTADQTIANTTTETTLFGTGVGTLTLPANFWVVGKTIRIEIHGDFADTGNPTAEVQAYYGATSLIDSGAITLSGLGGTEQWETEVVITCRSVGATGTVQTIIDWEYETTTGSSAIERLDVAGVVQTIDTTASGALDVTFQWGTAAAANTLTSEIGFVEVLN